MTYVLSDTSSNSVPVLHFNHIQKTPHTTIDARRFGLENSDINIAVRSMQNLAIFNSFASLKKFVAVHDISSGGGVTMCEHTFLCFRLPSCQWLLDAPESPSDHI